MLVNNLLKLMLSDGILPWPGNRARVPRARIQGRGTIPSDSITGSINLSKLFINIASTVSQLHENGEQKGSFRRLNDYDD